MQLVVFQVNATPCTSHLRALQQGNIGFLLLLLTCWLRVDKKHQSCLAITLYGLPSFFLRRQHKHTKYSASPLTLFLFFPHSSRHTNGSISQICAHVQEVLKSGSSHETRRSEPRRFSESASVAHNSCSRPLESGAAIFF